MQFPLGSYKLRVKVVSSISIDQYQSQLEHRIFYDTVSVRVRFSKKEEL